MTIPISVFQKAFVFYDSEVLLKVRRWLGNWRRRRFDWFCSIYKKPCSLRSRYSNHIFFSSLYDCRLFKNHWANVPNGYTDPLFRFLYLNYTITTWANNGLLCYLRNSIFIQLWFEYQCLNLPSSNGTFLKKVSKIMELTASTVNVNTSKIWTKKPNLPSISKEILSIFFAFGTLR